MDSNRHDSLSLRGDKDAELSRRLMAVDEKLGVIDALDRHRLRSRAMMWPLAVPPLGLALGFVSAGALGILCAAWPILKGLALTGIWPAPAWLRSVMGLTTLVLFLAVLFFVLRTVFHCAIDGTGGTSDPRETV